jgi:fucose permease
MMRQDFMLGLDAAGAISAVVTVGTIASSLLSGTLIRRFGEGKITLISGLMTGFALLGYSVAPSFIWFIVLAIPLGFGAGSVDTALNHYVALHFKAHHMNWLHSFWGVGATAGPVLMASILEKTDSWRLGYQTVAGIQLALALIIFISLPLWKKHGDLVEEKTPEIEEGKPIKGIAVLKVKGVVPALLIFMFYCAAEYAMGLWGASYLVQERGITLETAARWVAFYYGGITVGRVLAGFISFKLSNKTMILGGMSIALTGALLLLLNVSNVTSMLAFVLIGLGFAPIFPSMTHETPKRFGKSITQTVIGYQFTAAYVGIAVFPALIGIIIDNTSMIAFPIFILGCVGMQVLFFAQLKDREAVS